LGNSIATGNSLKRKIWPGYLPGEAERIRRIPMSKHKLNHSDKPDPLDAVSKPQTQKPDGLVDEIAISELAYLRWLERGCPQGSPDEDWFAAEEEIRSRGEASHDAG
jgi:hypothetical protein